jgi:hypothetical protein
MRLPHMTTRRWMVAVAAIAVAIGGYREARRLMRERDRRIAIANRHADAGAYYRGLIGTLARRMSLGQRTGPQPPAVNGELSMVIEHEFGLRLNQPPESSVDHRFQQAQERSYGFTAIRQQVLDDYNRRHSQGHAKQARYHARLERKYRRAARYPWLPVEPDPPEP